MNISIVHWAARECTRQQSGEMSVYNMCVGWEYALRHQNSGIFMNDILILGKLIEPEKNANGFRNTPVTVRGKVMLAPRLIQDALFNITRYQPEIGEVYSTGDGTGLINSADGWFKDYEEIHPFIDGNGRTGSILWNWLSGTLQEPQDPPDFWSP